jgi:hypothetical protein
LRDLPSQANWEAMRSSLDTVLREKADFETGRDAAAGEAIPKQRFWSVTLSFLASH